MTSNYIRLIYQKDVNPNKLPDRRDNIITIDTLKLFSIILKSAILTIEEEAAEEASGSK